MSKKSILNKKSLTDSRVNIYNQDAYKFVEKSSEFYKNDRTCKECRKEVLKKRYHEKSKDPNWVESERKRHREKYHRLNYKEKQLEWDKEKVWKKTSAYKNLSRDLKIPKGIHAHHWNYANDKLRDVVLMDDKDHKAFHQLIELDIEKRIFKIKETGEYLDSRNKHLCFIATSGFGFVEYNKNINYKLSHNE